MNESIATSHKKQRIIIIVSVIACLFIVIGILFYFLGVPLLKYQNAKKEMQAGNYDIAKEILVGLDDYKDANALVKNIENSKSCLQHIESLKNSIYESFNTLKSIESCWQKHWYKYATGEYKNTLVIFAYVRVEVGDKQDSAKTQKSTIDEAYNTILGFSDGATDVFLNEAINCATEIYNSYCSYYEFVDEPRSDHSYLTYVDDNEEWCNKLESLFNQINYYINR